jgi:hypothetical protein
MRRATTILGLAVVTAVLLAGCGRSDGVDGNLVDDWAALPAPAPFVPPAGVCHVADFAATVEPTAVDPVDCGVAHRLETVHVGAFTGTRSRPPVPGDAELRTAFAECDTRASRYVGAQWRDGRLWLGVALPTARAWSGGARWYRCDLAEQASVEERAGRVVRTASLRDALTGASPLRLGCQQARTGRNRTVETVAPVPCATAHNAEYVGTWLAPDRPYPARNADWAPFYTGCRSVLARYAGVPDDNDLRFRSGVVIRPTGAARWRAGDRGVRCYLWLSDRSVTGSLRAAGPARLPVRTR